MLLVGLVGFEPTTSLLKGDNPFTSGSLLQNLVVPAGLEPATPSFVAKYSNPLSYGTVKLSFWSAWMESNHRPQSYQDCALPTELQADSVCVFWWVRTDLNRDLPT
jgi:hypothetical protein